jgi:class 3 adenylate cyclase
VLATEGTLTAAGGGFACRPIGSVTVRGRETPVEVFEVTGAALPAGDDRERQAAGDGVSASRSRR